MSNPLALPLHCCFQQGATDNRCFTGSIYTTYDASRFVLTVPFHYMMMLMSVPAVLCALAFGMKAGHPWRNWGLLALLVFGLGLFDDGSELTLDRRTGRATLRRFVFFHWSTETFDLSQVRQVYVATGSTTSQLRLQLSDGSIRMLTFMDQDGGKEKVAFAANTFLGSGAGE